MTAEPPRTFPPRMPNPVDKVQNTYVMNAASAEQVKALAELLVQQWKAQEHWAQQVLERLDAMVALGQANKAALDAMQEKDPFSVQGLGTATTEEAVADEPDSPFIGG